MALEEVLASAAGRVLAGGARQRLIRFGDGDLPMQPAVAVELTAASGDHDGTFDSIVPDEAPALRSRGRYGRSSRQAA